jgi:hypothetical protein
MIFASIWIYNLMDSDNIMIVYHTFLKQNNFYPNYDKVIDGNDEFNMNKFMGSPNYHIIVRQRNATKIILGRGG